ncbi:hypothetical protein SAMN05421788_10627 [Filimonas lacunae]|uniref:Serine aminopeptidase S33 domain-containing protein n=1 Tax=Filimonas lacunae TaxID=477680 RepID=A0A173MEC9_9BACT|nr:alpha/beta fold hydrolase [Filimonas lacunae]BAV05953.1 hypothetical protein FLA_1966 [Filimonas lacunae]SIT23897.1 hypothetical protein SAMN05421788_10627 [Filimonas lacunae]
MKENIIGAIKIVAGLYVLVCILLYFFQEKLIFFPAKLDQRYPFAFQQRFEERNITTYDGKLLSGMLFKADSAKGLIFYLHGNSGSLASWGELAGTYTSLGYDVFMLDYRGFGKSEGVVTGQDQMFRDVQTAYDTLKKDYAEDKIVVLGYSLGSGLATKVAADNHPRLLILQAAYYSITDMMRHSYPVIPTFILKYKFATDQYIQQCKMPIVLFHGDKDEMIYYGSALKLKEKCKPQDTLITLAGQGHNGITENPDYKRELPKVLAR